MNTTQIENKILYPFLSFFGGVGLALIDQKVKEIVYKKLGIGCDQLNIIRNDINASDLNVIKINDPSKYVQLVYLPMLFIFGEEYFFRKLLEEEIIPNYIPHLKPNSKWNRLLSSTLFALGHWDHNFIKTRPDMIKLKITQIVTTFYLGLIFSVVKEKYGLLSSIFLHMGYNCSTSFSLHQDSLAFVLNALKRSNKKTLFVRILLLLLYDRDLRLSVMAKISLAAKAKLQSKNLAN